MTSNARRRDGSSDRHWLTACLAGLLATLAWIGSPASGADGPNADGKTFKRPMLIRFEGPITSRLEAFLQRKLIQAQNEGADLLILEIDSPGGLVDASLKSAERLNSIDWAHTVAYVPRQALSGAAIVSLGCRDIIMHPGATYGDAGPIFLGKDAAFRHAPEKLRSHLARLVRDMAEVAGRPPTLAEAMVDLDLIVYECVNTTTGEKRYLSELELKNLDDAADWKQGKMVHESREGHFLEVNGRRAVELQMAEATVGDLDELLELYDVTPDQLMILETNLVDTAVTVLNNPWVTGLLFVIGLVALFAELSAPGISIGGLTAGLCFSLFFWSRMLGGTADWLEVLLFLAGIVFIGIEIFVIPGFGVAGVTGLLLILAGVLMAGQRATLPGSMRELSDLGVNLAVFVGGTFGALIGMAVLSKYLGGIPVLNRLALEVPVDKESTSDDREAAKAAGRPPTAAENPPQVHVGDWGIADSMLRPAGKVRFDDDYIDVVTEGNFVDPGQQVRIVKITGNVIVVRAIE